MRGESTEWAKRFWPTVVEGWGSLNNGEGQNSEKEERATGALLQERETCQKAWQPCSVKAQVKEAYVAKWLQDDPGRAADELLKAPSNCVDVKIPSGG